jgi:UDP-glucose 4-epimerase
LSRLTGHSEQYVKVLATGGAGYIGATTVRSLLAAGHEVVVYDNLSKGHREAVPSGVAVVEGDVGDRNKLERVFQEHRPEAVLHFAGFIEAGESMLAPEKYFRNNSVAGLTLLEAMVANGVNKLIFSSTAAVYGEPRRTPIEETHPLEPINAYGESKLMVERMLSLFASIHRLRYASLRYFNAAGSDGHSGECHHPETHLIPLVLQVAAGRLDSISIFGTDYSTPDGTCIRDYIHVSDLARAHVLALEALATQSTLIYNLGNGRGFSVREVIESARRVTGRPIRVIETQRRPGDPAVLVASSEKIRRELDWVPEHPDLDSILASAWHWMQQHPTGYGYHPSVVGEES